MLQFDRTFVAIESVFSSNNNLDDAGLRDRVIAP